MRNLVKIILTYLSFACFIDISCLSGEIEESSSNHRHTDTVMTDVWQGVMVYLPIKDRLNLGTCSQTTYSSFSAMPGMAAIWTINKDLHHLIAQYPKMFVKNPERVVNPLKLEHILAQLADLSSQADTLLIRKKEIKRDPILYNYFTQINTHLSQKTKRNLHYFMGRYPLRISSEAKDHLSYLQHRVGYSSHYRPPIWQRLLQDPVFLFVTSVTGCYLFYYYGLPEPKEIAQNCGLDRKCKIVTHNNSRTFEVDRYHCYGREAESLIINTSKAWMDYLYENLKCNVTSLGEFFQREYGRGQDYFLQESVGINLYDEHKETEVRWYKFAPHANGESNIYIYQNPRECLNLAQSIGEGFKGIAGSLGLLVSTAYFVFSIYYVLNI